MPFADVKPILPAKMNIAKVERAIFKALEAEGVDDQALFNKTIATWKNEKPTFKSKTGYRGIDGYVFTGPTGSKKGVNKFTWLDRGTKVRWAVMSKNWKSKTRRGHISSSGGRGYVVVAGKRAMQRRRIRPRPGIEAREFSPTIQKRRAGPFQTRLRQANKAAVEAIYAG